MRTTITLLLISAFFVKAGFSQEPGPTPTTASVTVINCAETSLPERWRASLDVQFKKEWLARDIRLGERSPYRQITYTGDGMLEIFLHGNPTAVLKVPVSFESGGMYSLLILGSIEANQAELRAKVIKEFPVEEGVIRPGLARLVIVNAISSYPILFSVGEDSPKLLPVGQDVSAYVKPGEHPISMWFPFKDGKPRRIVSAIIAEPNSSYTLAIYGSQERADRPAMFRSHSKEDKQNLDDEAEAAKESAVSGSSTETPQAEQR